MRICEKHRERASETLVSRKTGTEYDLCPKCEAELFEILNEKPEIPAEKGEELGRKRTPRKAKKS